MPTRTSEHTQGGYVRAAFIVACESLSRLTPGRAAQIIERILDLEASTFTEWAAIVEYGPQAGTGLIPALERPDLPPGEAEFRTLETVDELLREKYEHERPKHRKPGNPSYRAPTLLRPDVCAIVVGSREFLQTNIELYLDEKPTALRRHILHAARRICALVEPQVAGRNYDEKTFCRVPEQGSLRVWGGNFDALWERGNRERLSHEELLARLGAHEVPPVEGPAHLTPQEEEADGPKTLC